MLGGTLFRLFSVDDRFETFGTIRSEVDATNLNSLEKTMKSLQPNTVVNCIGLINKKIGINNLEEALEINGKFPHHLAKNCRGHKARLIHFSTDCVFSGLSGNYSEEDIPDSEDWYGMTKLAGEVNLPNTLTIRTSLIGPEYGNKYGLLEWFLSQKGKVDGYTRAIFSGFPTIEMARIISDFIIPRTDITGLFHISSKPISKYDLLKLIAERYNKNIKINPVNEPTVDRSLNSNKFCQLTGYQSPSWTDLVDSMYLDHVQLQ